MTPDEASKLIESKIATTNEDVSRAKSWIMQSTETGLKPLTELWLQKNKVSEPKSICTESDNCENAIFPIANAYSLRLSLYRAAWELISQGFIVSVGQTEQWTPNLQYDNSGSRGSVTFRSPLLTFPYPSKLFRLKANEPFTADIFLNGVDCDELHEGIVHAVQESLECFRRGLYLPSIAMLFAAVEATWHECGLAVAKNLSDSKLLNTLNDPFVGIAKVASDLRKILEQNPSLLSSAGRTRYQIADAEVWTTALRERRNTLHWGKAKSFIADHADTGTLLMAAPNHLKTLEAVRIAC